MNYTMSNPGEMCIVHNAENGWLIVHCLSFGHLIPGQHYAGGVGRQYAKHAAGKNTELHLNYEPFWSAIENSTDYDPTKNGYFTSGNVWPMIKKDDVYTPATYPPLHMHHGFWMSPGINTHLQHAGDDISITYSAETYCREREDHCLWFAFPDKHGFT